MSVSEPLHTSLSELNSVCSVSRKWQKCFSKLHSEPWHTYSENTRFAHISTQLLLPWHV